MKKEKKFAKMK